MRALRDVLVLAGPMMALVWLVYGLCLALPAIRRWLTVVRAKWELRSLDRVVAKWAHPANRLAERLQARLGSVPQRRRDVSRHRHSRALESAERPERG
jgi:biopolymer transport protein ExbB/TolQ